MNEYYIKKLQEEVKNLQNEQRELLERVSLLELLSKDSVQFDIDVSKSPVKCPTPAFKVVPPEQKSQSVTTNSHNQKRTTNK